MTCIIAIAAGIGGGKSSLVSALAQALGGVPTLHFDDYEEATSRSPHELMEWLDAGADFNTLPAPGFAETLAALKEANADGLGAREEVEYAVVEFPLGRTYDATAHLLDILIWVDTPLDIGLARNLRSLLSASRTDRSLEPGEFDRWLENYLATYIQVLHPLLELQRRRVSPGADFILDGRDPVDSMVAATLEGIRRMSLG